MQHQWYPSALIIIDINIASKDTAVVSTRDAAVDASNKKKLNQIMLVDTSKSKLNLMMLVDTSKNELN